MSRFSIAQKSLADGFDYGGEGTPSAARSERVGGNRGGTVLSLDNLRLLNEKKVASRSY